MTQSEPIRTRARLARPHRRHVLLGAVPALLLTTTACTMAPHLFSDTDTASPSTDGGSGRRQSGTSWSVGGWPQHGQAAYVLGDGPPEASPDEQPVPIASVAKVMTAYLVLKHYPLSAGDSGRIFAVGQSDVADTDTRRRAGQSTVDVRADEQLTERDALMAVLLPSANNIAQLLARQVDGSVASFVAEMNQTARTLGMAQTTYTDPSGYDAGTVSTALDQLLLARLAAENETLAAMMATRSYSLPVAGAVTNTDTCSARTDSSA